MDAPCPAVRASFALGLTVSALAAACQSNDDGVAACPPATLLVAASDYASSSVGGTPNQGLAGLASGLDLGKDPQLSLSNGRAFFLARDNDLVFELDPTCGKPRSRMSVHELAKVGSANPHDVAAAGDGTLFVPLYNVPKVAVLRDGKVDGAIDLARFDPDGNPQAESIAIVRVDGVEKAFVTLERLDDADGLRAKQRAQMLRFDVASRAIEGALDLVGENPFNRMVEVGSALLLAEPGNFDSDADPRAGIERFDTATSTSAMLVAEKDLGGSVAEIAVEGGCGAAIVAGPAPNVNPTTVLLFDATNGRVLSRQVLGPTPGFDLQGLAWKEGHLYVGDRRPGPIGYRVHVFDRNGERCAVTPSTRTIDLPQRPVALKSSTSVRTL